MSFREQIKLNICKSEFKRNEFQLGTKYKVSPFGLFCGLQQIHLKLLNSVKFHLNL